jgi:hypothetical protein
MFLVDGQVRDLSTIEAGPDQCSLVRPGLMVRGEDALPQEWCSTSLTQGSHAKVIELERQDIANKIRVACVDCLAEVGVRGIGVAPLVMASLEEIKKAMFSASLAVLEDKIRSQEGVFLVKLWSWKTAVLFFRKTASSMDEE